MRIGRVIVALMLPLFLMSCTDYLSLPQRISALENQVASMSNNNKFVTLASPVMQPTNSPLFNAKITGVEEHLTGVTISGRLLNVSSVTYGNAQFNVSISDKSNMFYIPSIAPGSACDFSVYIPDVPIKDAKYAIIKEGDSTVSYHMNRSRR